MRCMVSNRLRLKGNGLRCERAKEGMSTQRRRAQRTGPSDCKCRLIMPLQTILNIPTDLCRAQLAARRAPMWAACSEWAGGRGRLVAVALLHRTDPRGCLSHLWLPFTSLVQ